MTIYSAHLGTNAELFPGILSIFLKEGSTIADVNYGKGVFWRKVDLTKYKLLATDLKDGVDMRVLPYEDGSLDGLVMDPPYMPTEYTGVKQISDYYGIERKFGKTKWAKGVLELYFEGVREANRVLNKNGTLIVKCQDMVCANKQVLSHNEIIQYASEWFQCEDIFILVQKNKRPHPKKYQLHARKNHSYFLVFIRKGRKWVGHR